MINVGYFIDLRPLWLVRWGGWPVRMATPFPPTPNISYAMPSNGGQGHYNQDMHLTWHQEPVRLR